MNFLWLASHIKNKLCPHQRLPPFYLCAPLRCAQAYGVRKKALRSIPRTYEIACAHKIARTLFRRDGATFVRPLTGTRSSVDGHLAFLCDNRIYNLRSLESLVLATILSGMVGADTSLYPKFISKRSQTWEPPNVWLIQ